MITIERSATEDEIYILDETGKHQDIQIVLDDDGKVFLVQHPVDYETQVIEISQEMFGNIWIALGLEDGVWQVNDEEVVKPTLN